MQRRSVIAALSAAIALPAIGLSAGRLAAQSSTNIYRDFLGMTAVQNLSAQDRVTALLAQGWQLADTGQIPDAIAALADALSVPDHVHPGGSYADPLYRKRTHANLAANINRASGDGIVSATLFYPGAGFAAYANILQNGTDGQVWSSMATTSIDPARAFYQAVVGSDPAFAPGNPAIRLRDRGLSGVLDTRIMLTLIDTAALQAGSGMQFAAPAGLLIKTRTQGT